MPRGHHPLWVTKFWWSSDPPDRSGYKSAVQARYIAESLYLFWRAGAQVAINLKIRDSAKSSELGTGPYSSTASRSRPRRRFVSRSSPIVGAMAE